MSENQVETKTTNGFWAKFGKWIMFAIAGLATLLTLGALARKNAGANPIDGDVQKKIDDLDKQAIADVIEEVNNVGNDVEDLQKKAAQASTDSNNVVDNVQEDFAAVANPSDKIAKFNSGMQKRRN